MSADELERYRRSLLVPLLHHAKATVPFHHERKVLNPLFRRDGSVDWDRWCDIPPLTRHEVLANCEALMTECLPEWHGNTWTTETSGSTGEPLRIRGTGLAAQAWMGQLLRDFARHGIDPQRTIVFVTRRSRALSNQSSGTEGWFPELAELGFRGQRFDIPDTRSIDELLEDILTLESEYLWLHPSILQLLCANDRDGRLAAAGLDAVLTVGMRFPVERRREMAEYLGCKIVDQYACQECGRVASTCPTCGHYHVDAEVVLLEVLDDDRTPVGPGEAGRVALTPYYKYAMPLIRYLPKDFVELGQAHISCQQGRPTIVDVYGKEPVGVSVGGGIVPLPTLSAREVESLLGARAFQIAKISSRRCEFRIVPGARLPSEEMLADMTRRIHGMWLNQLDVEYRFVDEIPRNSPDGKMMLYVDETKFE